MHRSQKESVASTSSFDEKIKPMNDFPNSMAEKANSEQESFPVTVRSAHDEVETENSLTVVDMQTLSIPGKFDGEVKVCYHKTSSSFVLYTWYASSGTWKRTEVLHQDTSDQQEVESDVVDNAEEDYDEEDEDLKICVFIQGKIYTFIYSTEEDAWTVARSFVTEYELPVEYIGQIASFVTRNPDPNIVYLVSDSKLNFPVTNYTTFYDVDKDGLRAQLLQANEYLSKRSQISSSDIDNLMLLTEFPDEVSNKQMLLLDIILSWSDEFLNPVLDFLLLAVRSDIVSANIGTFSFVNYLLRVLHTTQSNCNMDLVIKVFCNFCASESGAKTMMQSQEKIFQSIKEVCISDETVNEGGISFFLNFAVAALNGSVIDLETYCACLTEILVFMHESDACLLGLLAVGTICAYSSEAAGYFMSLDIKNVLDRFKKYTTIPQITELLSCLLVHFE